MESNGTYVNQNGNVGLPAPGERITSGAGIKKDSKTQDKKKPLPKLLITLVLLICFLLATVIGLRIHYVLVSARLLQTEQQLEQLQSKYTQAKKYIMCTERPSDSDCVEFFRLGCPEGWVLNNSQCYFFSTDSLYWERSRDSCRSKQADLVIISDSKEQEFITETKSPGVYWLGLTDREIEGQWKWVDGSTLQPETFWACRQPDNTLAAEDCVTLGVSPCPSILQNWNDDSCLFSRRYICEKEATDARREIIF